VKKREKTSTSSLGRSCAAEEDSRDEIKKEQETQKTQHYAARQSTQWAS
jgi:hypothetical protein